MAVVACFIVVVDVICLDGVYFFGLLCLSCPFPTCEVSGCYSGSVGSFLSFGCAVLLKCVRRLALIFVAFIEFCWTDGCVVVLLAASVADDCSGFMLFGSVIGFLRAWLLVFLL